MWLGWEGGDGGREDVSYGWVGGIVVVRDGVREGREGGCGEGCGGGVVVWG